MLGDITIGQFFPGDTVVHRVDPRVKLVLTVLYIIAVFMVRSVVGYGLLLLCVLAIARMSKVPFKYIMKGLKPILFICIFTFTLNIFFTKGENLIFEWKFIKIYKESLINAVYFALRLVFLVIGTSLLTLTTSPMALTDGLERLLKPLKKIKFPVHELSMMMSIALRFIPTLLEETDKIMKAQIARGADFESGNIFERAKAMIPLLVPLFVSAFRRADELAMAMESRCYRGDVNRTRMKTLKMEKRDYTAIALSFVVLALVIVERSVL
ncbi:MAG: energy-coupling factor transporter transmembrane protein EcfT [Clostridiales bacterium]|nr:energy-coupling factor transporter transmembrane protein EcfT [Clostridiales bacterium]